MEKSIILEVGGEGGSIMFFRTKSNEYAFTTDESVMRDMLSEEDQKDIEFVKRSDTFESFDEAMESLLKKYPVFNLYPITVNPSFKDRINAYFKQYVKRTKIHEFAKEDWQRKLET
jgi:hypothetical protein